MGALALLAKAHLPTDPHPQLLHSSACGVVERYGRYVTKTLEGAPEGMFHAQARALFALSQCGFKVPELFWQDQNGLVMSVVESVEPNWESTAKVLAKLHQLNMPAYGWDTPVFLGTLELPNTPQPDWTSFFWHNRIEPLLEGAHLPGTWQHDIAKVFEVPLPTEGPVLLHGDLWHGNLMHASSGPIFLDPSCWWGERAVDLAMMQLLGGFSDSFWRFYQVLNPIPQAIKQVLPRYQLYYALAHVRLHGAVCYGMLEQVLQQALASLD